MEKKKKIDAYLTEKSRREKRKEARLSKNARNHESWLQHKVPCSSKNMLFFSSVFFGSKFFLWMCFFFFVKVFDAMLSKLFPVETLSLGFFI